MRLSFLIILCFATFASADPTRNLDWLTKNPTIVRLVALQNAERSRSGLPALRLDDDLCLKAQRYAELMDKTGTYQHSQLGIRENIHWMVRQPEQAVTDWMRSDGHRRNILSASTKIGVGYDYSTLHGSRLVTLFQ